MVRGVEVARAAPEACTRETPSAVDAHRHEPLARDAGLRWSCDDPFLADTDVFVPLAGTRGARRARDGARGLAPRDRRVPGRRAALGRRRSASPSAAGGSSVGRSRRSCCRASSALGDLPFVDRAPTPRTRAPLRAAARRRARVPRDPRVPARRQHAPRALAVDGALGAVMVREFEEETTRRLAIVVDTLTDVGEAWTPLDAACSAAVVGRPRRRRARPGGPARRSRGRRGGRHCPRRRGGAPGLAGGDSGRTDRSVARHRRRAPAARCDGMESALLVLPTWRANDLAAVVPAVRDLAEETGRVAVLRRSTQRRWGAARGLPAGGRAVGPRGRARRRRRVGVPLARRRAARRGVRARGGARMRIARPSKGPPEDSIALRLIAAAAVEVAILAVVAQGAVDASPPPPPSLLAPLGYWFSYRQRHRSAVATKVVLAVGLMVAFAAFLQQMKGATTVDEVRLPLASLFLWVQVLHAFDVPRRRDLAFSAVSSVILMAEAGSALLRRRVPALRGAVGGAHRRVALPVRAAAPGRHRSDRRGTQELRAASPHRRAGALDRRREPRGPRGGDRRVPRHAAAAGRDRAGPALLPAGLDTGRGLRRRGLEPRPARASGRRPDGRSHRPRTRGSATASTSAHAGGSRTRS